MTDPLTEIYAAIGREEPFYHLVEAFYQEVEHDLALRALYPSDLAPGKKHLAWFLIQRFGGPAHYSIERGHPKLRPRHLPFSIGPTESQAWLNHMTKALAVTPEFLPFEAVLQRYFSETTTFLINQPEIPAESIPIGLPEQSPHTQS